MAVAKFGYSRNRFVSCFKDTNSYKEPHMNFINKTLVVGILATTAGAASAVPIFSFTQRAGFEDDVGIAVYTNPLVPGGLNPNQTVFETMSWVEGSSPQSSLDLDNFGGGITAGVWTTISKITHTNNIIPGATSWSGQDIWGRLIITDSGDGPASVRVNDVSPITIALTETLNAAPCPAPNPVGSTCDDFWGFTASGLDSLTFTANNGSTWLAEFQFGNLVNAVFLNGVIYVAEANVGSLDVQMRLTQQQVSTVPEPATLGLFGLGLLGLGLAKRRKQNIQA